MTLTSPMEKKLRHIMDVGQLWEVNFGILVDIMDLLIPLDR